MSKKKRFPFVRRVVYSLPPPPARFDPVESDSEEEEHEEEPYSNHVFVFDISYVLYLICMYKFIYAFIKCAITILLSQERELDLVDFILSYSEFFSLSILIYGINKKRPSLMIPQLLIEMYACCELFTMTVNFFKFVWYDDDDLKITDLAIFVVSLLEEEILQEVTDKNVSYAALLLCSSFIMIGILVTQVLWISLLLRYREYIKRNNDLAPFMLNQ